jgi:hypothetical protein
MASEYLNPGNDSISTTMSRAVAALLALLGSTTNHAASWDASKDPCGSANCTASNAEAPAVQYAMAMAGQRQNVSQGTPCQWEGISCRWGAPLTHHADP